MPSASSTTGFSGISLAAAELVVGGDHRDGARVDDALLQLFAEKPPNTTECVAPMRAHACIATTAWIDIGM